MSGNSSSRRRWKIDGNLLPIKIHYFLQYAGVSVIWPFVPVIGRQLGISPFAVGFLLGIASLCIWLVKPLLKLIKNQKTVFIAALAFSCISLVSFTIFPQPEISSTKPVEFECGNRGSNYIKQCKSEDVPKKLSSHEQLICRPSTEKNYVNDSYSSSVIDGKDSKLTSFLEHSSYASVQHGGGVAANISTTNDTSSLTELEDVCYITCKSIDYAALLQFCANFVGSTPPIKCTRLTNILKSDQIVEKETKDEIYYLQFEAKLKVLRAHQSGENCLYIPIDAISFRDESSSHNATNGTTNNTMAYLENEPDQLAFEKFSCLPNSSILSQCFANCPYDTFGLNSYLEVFDQLQHDFIYDVRFGFFTVIILLGVVSLAIVNSISDSLCSELVYDNADKYCAQKLFGIAGAGVFCLLSGYFVDRISPGKIIKEYSPCFFLIAGLFTLDFVVAFKLKVKETAPKQSLLKDLQTVMRDPRITLFLIDCIILGICSGIHQTFLFWYIEELNEVSGCADASDWIKFLEACTIAVACLTEILFFTVSGWLLNKFGYFNCMSLVLLMSAIQFAMYSLISTPWTFVPLELFQGIISSIFTTTTITYGSVAVSLAGRQNSPRIKQFFGIAFNIIGIGTGCILGGYFFEHLGGKLLFIIIAGSCLLSFCLHIGLVYYLNRRIDFGHTISNSSPYATTTTTSVNPGTPNEQKLQRMSRNDSQEFEFEFESDID